MEAVTTLFPCQHPFPCCPFPLLPQCSLIKIKIKIKINIKRFESFKVGKSAHLGGWRLWGPYSSRCNLFLPQCFLLLLLPLTIFLIIQIPVFAVGATATQAAPNLLQQSLNGLPPQLAEMVFLTIEKRWKYLPGWKCPSPKNEGDSQL